MKKAVTLALTLALSVSMAACGSKSETKEEAKGGASSAPVKKTSIKYWTDDRHDADFIKEAAAKFNSTNKDGIEVEVNVMSENYKQAVDIAYASNQAPDVIRVKANTINEFVKKGFLEPIDNYVTDDMKKKFTSMDGVNTFDGKIYSLPSTGQTLRLIYNKDLFQKAGIQNPPTSLKEMADVAKKLTEAGKKDGAYGFALNFKSPKSAFERSMRAILPASGVHYENYDLKTGKYDFTAFGKAMQYFKQMKDEGSMLPGFEALDIDPLRAQFAEGKIGMYFSYSSEPGVYQNQFPAKIKWGVAPVPTIDGKQEGPSAILGAGIWLGLSKNSANKDAAWKFIQYMYNDEVLTGYHEKGLGLVILPHIVEKAKKPELPGMDGFQVTKNDAIWPVNPAVAPQGMNYADAFFKYILTGGDINKVVEDLNTRYNDALDKAVAKGDVKVKADAGFDPKALLRK